MNTQAFLMNLAIILVLMAVAAAIEAFVPLFERGESSKGRTRINLSMMALVFTTNFILTSVTAVVALKLRPAGLLAGLKLPFAAELVITIVVLDFCYGYAAHFLLHKIPFLWKAHAIHHSDPFVDVTTNFRTHPIETVWRFLFMTAPAWILGLPAAAIVIYRLIGSSNAIFEHANIRLWAPLDRIGSFLWVTPNMHKIHHSRLREETDSNYGNILSTYDRLFGTYTPTDRLGRVRYGLDEFDGNAQSFVALLKLPWQPR